MKSIEHGIFQGPLNPVRLELCDQRADKTATRWSEANSVCATECDSNDDGLVLFPVGKIREETTNHANPRESIRGNSRGS